MAEDQAALKQGSEILAPFKQQLQQTLQSGMAKGPGAAIDICRLQAPVIASGIATAEVTVGRTSHKLRNPGNSPKPWMQAVIEIYLADPSARVPVATRLQSGRTGYAEPILIKPMCLACHGVNLAAEITNQLQRYYPADQAIGFANGDLRGIFWAEFPAN